MMRQGLLVLMSVTIATPALADVPTETAAHERARFSGKRLAVEIAAGELAGALAAGLTFSGLCHGDGCLGAGLAAFGADFAVAPLAVWGTGEAMGGAGSLGYTYLGATTALAAFSVPGSPDETPADTASRIGLELTISSLLMPACSALLYEVSSNQRWVREHAVTIAVRPLYERTGTGGIGMVSARW